MNQVFAVYNSIIIIYLSFMHNTLEIYPYLYAYTIDILYYGYAMFSIVSRSLSLFTVKEEQ